MHRDASTTSGVHRVCGAAGSSLVKANRKGQAAVCAQIDHVLVADEAGFTAVQIPLGRMNLFGHAEFPGNTAS